MCVAKTYYSRCLFGFLAVWLLIGNTKEVAANTQTLSLCKDSVVTLTATYNGNNPNVEYHWYLAEYNGTPLTPPQVLSETGQQIQIKADNKAVYICETVSPQRTTSQNLMKNGDFEDTNGATNGNTTILPPYFTSSYSFAGWEVPQPSDYENRYTMSHDASHYYNGFLPIKPHGGQWFALFDATANGFAWKAATANNNPNLKIVAGQEYVFSYWVANPNNNNNPTAQLQFYIEYRDPQNNLVSQNIGTVYDIIDAKNKGWVQQTVVWTAPESSNDVAIAVKDLVNSSAGNDFCLDDIIFQETTTVQQTVLHTDSFVISLLPAVDMYAKWDDVIFVPNTDSLYVAYQWYHDGVAIEGAVKQFYYLPEGLSGSYYCVMQTRDGDTVETCPAEFENLGRSAEQNPGNAPKILVTKRTYPVGAHLQIVVSVYDDNTITAEKYWK